MDADDERDDVSRVGAEGGGGGGSQKPGQNGIDLVRSAIGTLKCLRSRMRTNERSLYLSGRAKQRRVLGCASV